MHSAVTVIALPAAEKHGAIVVAGHVASESNIAHGPLIIIDVVEEQVVEVLIQPLLPSPFEIGSIQSCAAASLPCRDGSFNVPVILSSTPASECPTCVDLTRVDLDLVLDADALATLDVIE